MPGKLKTPGRLPAALGGQRGDWLDRPVSPESPVSADIRRPPRAMREPMMAPVVSAHWCLGGTAASGQPPRESDCYTCVGPPPFPRCRKAMRGPGREATGLAAARPAEQRPRQAEARQQPVVGEPGQRADPVAGQGEHEQAVAMRHRDPRLGQVAAERGLPVGAGGQQPVPQAAGERDAGQQLAGRRTWYATGRGGMVSRTSAVSRARMASMSARSTARLNAPAIRCSQAECGGGAGSRPRGSRASSVARACCNASCTAGPVVSSIPATSAARKPSTSRRISTARCPGGRQCSAATKASDTDSVAG